jgi:hypothetical protein
MTPVTLLIFFAVVLVVFVGSGVLGIIQSRRKRNEELRRGSGVNRRKGLYD